MIEKLYDSRDTSISIDGRVVTGFQANDMFSFTAKEDKITTEVDAQGTATMSVNNARLAQITLNLAATSPDYKWCMDRANSMAEFPVVIKDNFEKVTCNRCFFSKVPDIAAGKTAGARTFVIETLDSTVEVLS